ncbi:MAG: C40 family peptidase [Spirochaetia bacterium]|nr:C40 family peptidase [Spirochaetia bacterium]
MQEPAEWVKDYIGIPFVSGGRDPNIGLDCYGLFRHVLNHIFGKNLPMLSGGYEDACNPDEAGRIYDKNKPLIAGSRIAQPEYGCGVVLKYSGRPTHVGIYVGGGYILHTTAQTGSVLESVDSPQIRCRIEGYYHVN